jgi:hypothetical protein
MSGRANNRYVGMNSTQSDEMLDVVLNDSSQSDEEQDPEWEESLALTEPDTLPPTESILNLWAVSTPIKQGVGSRVLSTENKTPLNSLFFADGAEGRSSPSQIQFNASKSHNLASLYVKDRGPAESFATSRVLGPVSSQRYDDEARPLTNSYQGTSLGQGAALTASKFSQNSRYEDEATVGIGSSAVGEPERPRDSDFTSIDFDSEYRSQIHCKMATLSSQQLTDLVEEHYNKAKKSHDQLKQLTEIIDNNRATAEWYLRRDAAYHFYHALVASTSPKNLIEDIRVLPLDTGCKEQLASLLLQDGNAKFYDVIAAMSRDGEIRIPR